MNEKTTIGDLTFDISGDTHWAGDFTISSLPPMTLSFNDHSNGRPVVNIDVVDKEVQVTLADGATMNEAAVAFFDALQFMLPGWIEQNGWVPKNQSRPISSAPKDGTAILGWAKDEPAYGPESMFFEDSYHQQWQATFYDGYLPLQPTHWMPLPKNGEIQ